jgi:hypothetical protein
VRAAGRGLRWVALEGMKPKGAASAAAVNNRAVAPGMPGGVKAWKSGLAEPASRCGAECQPRANGRQVRVGRGSGRRPVGWGTLRRVKSHERCRDETGPAKLSGA